MQDRNNPHAMSAHPCLSRLVSLVTLIAVLSVQIAPLQAAIPSDDLEGRLQASPAVRELLELTVDTLRRASLADPEDLRLAVETRDPRATAEALALPLGQAERLAARMEFLRQEILLEFPELRALADRRPSASCVAAGTCWGEPAPPALEALASAMGDIVESFNDPAAKSGDSSGCHWIQLVAELSLCTLSGPYFYWVCAYVAYCSSCWGPIHDSICF